MNRKALNKWLAAAFFSLLLASPMASPGAAAEPQGNHGAEQVRNRLEMRIMDRVENRGFACRGEPICGIELMPLFYAQRAYEPVWVDGRGPLPAAARLLDLIRQSRNEGLQPAVYHLAAAESMLAELQAPGDPSPEYRELMATRMADLDILLTDSFLLLTSHLSGGQVDPETLHPDWLTVRHQIDPTALLKAAAGGADMAALLDGLRPAHKAYRRLVAARADLVKLAEKGPWPRIPEGPTLGPGLSDNRVALLRQRLRASGDFEAPHRSAPDNFDPDLSMAVRRFQEAHGLKPDALVGRNTLAALNTGIRQRLRIIDLNLERWRWLPRDLGERYLQVNTADYQLKVIEKNEAVLEMRVVVGRPARRTPVFSADMTYLVLNPYWTVPRTIAIEDILPQLVQGADYLDKQGIKVFDGWSEDALEIDPRQIDWSLYGISSFPFRLRQEPGPANALGQIKFMFPNKFAVYLHDTPNRSLFQRVQRDFSSGCIRVEDATALALYLLKDHPAWPPDKITQALEQGTHRVVRLPSPIPVHLLYMTAWADENGRLQFREDIYNRDRDLDKALQNRRLTPPQKPSAIQHARTGTKAF